MDWQPILLEQLSSAPRAVDRLDVWWWPEALHPPIAGRRQRTDAILRRVLAPYLSMDPADLRFGREAHGRPYLLHPGAPDFNLSDTPGGTVVAIAAQGRVGVDIERCDRVPPVARLAPRWFASEEAQALQQLAPESARKAFLRLWTAKEAACKATGTGIFGYLSKWRFGVVMDDSNPRLVSPPDDAGDAARWRFHRLAPVATHTVVIACRDLAGGPSGFIVTASD